MIYFLGQSHAATHLRAAAVKRRLVMAESIDAAHVVFVSEDTPTDTQGNRGLERIISLVKAAATTKAQIVLTSQVPPGFTRSISVKLGIPNIFHQPETLRILDADFRALHPEYIVVGGPGKISHTYAEYLAAFECVILRMSWEEAEFSKIAVNMFLAAQVDTTNRLAAAAAKVGADWNYVANALKHDQRIGQHAYLTSGRWQDSKHLLRDSVTLTEIEHEPYH